MKTAVVSGVAGGMGFETAKKLTGMGFAVYGLDIRKPDEDLAGLIYIETDLTDAGSVERAYQQICKECDRVDCLIHLAGIYDLNSLVEISEEEFIRLFQINFFSVFRLNKVFLPLLKEGSRIIITSSELAPLEPLPFTGLYGLSKGGVEKYAFSLRKELQLLGIKVIVLRPGAVDTGLLDVSQKRLDDFCENTQLYTYNAKRFHSIVDKVEARKVPPTKIADLIEKALSAKNPRFVYSINRNPLLLLMNLLPSRLQDLALRIILKP